MIMICSHIYYHDAINFDVEGTPQRNKVFCETKANMGQPAISSSIPQGSGKIGWQYIFTSVTPN